MSAAWPTVTALTFHKGQSEILRSVLEHITNKRAEAVDMARNQGVDLVFEESDEI